MVKVMVRIGEDGSIILGRWGRCLVKVSFYSRDLPHLIGHRRRSGEESLVKVPHLK
jgi:hypothetical protein